MRPLFSSTDSTLRSDLLLDIADVDEPWAAPFVSLLRGYREEIVLRESKQLDLIMEAARDAVEIGCPADVSEKLEKLLDVLERKKDLVRTLPASLLFSRRCRLTCRIRFSARNESATQADLP